MFLSGSIGASVPDAHDDFWYQDVSPATAAGPHVTEDSAMRTSAVFSCVRILAESVAQLPLKTYERLSDGGKRVVDEHQLYTILHDQANEWQTSFEYREMMQGHLALRGKAFALKDVDYHGRLLGLIPLHPNRVEVGRLDSGRIHFQVKDGETILRPGTVQNYSMEEMHYLRGLSSDGLIGISPIAQAREAVGMAIAAEEYGARLFNNDTRPPGIIEHPGHFKDDESLKRFKKGWHDAQSGVNRHKTAVLEFGMKYHDVGMTNEDAQFLETRKYQLEDIARIFRIPLHLISHTEKASAWGTGIEQMTIGFVVFTLGPWLTRWEQAITRDMITRPKRYFAEFLVDGLLRGDIKSRYDAYGSAIDHGWMLRNEARLAENRNPLPGLDKPLQPLNMAEVGKEVDEEAVARMVSAEISDLRSAYDPDRIGKFVSDARDIYIAHAKRLEITLGMSALAADTYCQVSGNEIRNAENVPVLLDQWEQTRARDLLRYTEMMKR